MKCININIILFVKYCSYSCFMIALILKFTYELTIFFKLNHTLYYYILNAVKICACQIWLYNINMLLSQRNNNIMEFVKYCGYSYFAAAMLLKCELDFTSSYHISYDYTLYGFIFLICGILLYGINMLMIRHNNNIIRIYLMTQ